MNLKKRFKIYQQLKKSIEKPFWFIVNFYLMTRLKIRIIKKVKLKNGLLYNLTDPTDNMLILEYTQNYYDIQNIKPNNVCVDVGANSGDFSIFCSKKFKEIYAFEPIPKTFQLMNENIKLNKLLNIKTYNYGLSDKTKTAKFDLPKFTGVAKINKHGKNNIYVISWSKMQSIVEKKINLLKIDCEGAEYSILNDNQFLKNVDEIRMELHIFNKNDRKKAHKLIDLFTNKYNFQPNLPNIEIYNKIKTEVGFELILKKQ